MSEASEMPHLDDALSAFLDGELPAEEEAPVRAHLGACGSCSAELGGLRSVRSSLRSLPPEEPPFGFLERLARPHHVSGRWAAAAGSGYRRRRRRAGAAALAATAAASVGILLLSSPVDAPVSPQMTRLVEAHAASSSGDPISQLAPVGVPVTFRR